MFKIKKGLATNSSNCVELVTQEGIVITSFTVNDSNQGPRKETLEGREHLVIPVIAVQEQVLNGELAPAEEIGAYPPMWNGIPIPVNHPEDENGVAISANSPDIYNTDIIGQLFNAEFEDDKLKGEIWIDIEKAKFLGGEAEEVLNRAEAGEPIEVSTAYFRDIEETSGEFNGVAYNGIQRNLRPDHLAVLPSDVGACSLDDGCGANVTNSDSKSSQQSVKVEVDTSPLKSMITDFKDFIKNTFKGGNSMNKQELIEKIMSNKCNKFDEEVLNSMEVNQLQIVYNGLDCDGDDGEGEGEGQASSQESTKDSKGEGDGEGQVTNGEGYEDLSELSQALQEVGGVDKLVEAVKDLQANKDNEKQEIINRIVANEECPYDADNLQPMCIDNLKKLDKLLNGVNYAGKGVPRMETNNSDEDTVEKTPSILLNRGEGDK